MSFPILSLSLSHFKASFFSVEKNQLCIVVAFPQNTLPDFVLAESAQVIHLCTGRKRGVEISQAVTK